MSDVVSVFANRVQGIFERRLPANIEATARLLILDALGCALAGIGTDAWIAARRGALGRGSEVGATVLGDDNRHDPADASFVNIIAGRTLLFDDTYGPGYLHAGVSITFASLATAEVEQKTFEHVTRAVVAGIEISARIAEAAGEVQYSRGFHNTGTCLTFGTAAAVAQLMGLGTDTTAEAIRLAGEYAAGLRRYQIDGSSAISALHAANAAQWGIRCARLAKAGFGGVDGVLEGDNGFLRTFGSEPNFDRDRLLSDLEASCRISDVSIKPFPSCRSTHGAATAALELQREYSFADADVERISVTVSPHAFKCDRPRPDSELDAQFSIQYVVARILVHGGIASDEFDTEHRADSRVLALMERIDVHCDPLLRDTHTIMQMETASGGKLKREVLQGSVLGDAANALARDDVRRKYMSNAANTLDQRSASLVADLVLYSRDDDVVLKVMGMLKGAGRKKV